MADKKKHKLLYPPRYRRGDPQNIYRIKEAHERSRQQRQSARGILPAAGVTDEGENNGARGFDYSITGEAR
ncbi:hypothetical protein ES708_16664 [subsurface metagenome]